MPLRYLTFPFVFLWGSAFATSEISPQNRVQALSDCRVKATFIQEKAVEKKVYWEFRKLSGSCDGLDPQTIVVRIRPGQYVERLGKFIYPEFLEAPLKNKNYALKLVFFGSEIQFVDWKTGVTAIP